MRYKIIAFNPWRSLIEDHVARIIERLLYAADPKNYHLLSDGQNTNILHFLAASFTRVLAAQGITTESPLSLVIGIKARDNKALNAPLSSAQELIISIYVEDGSRLLEEELTNNEASIPKLEELLKNLLGNKVDIEIHSCDSSTLTTFMPTIGNGFDGARFNIATSYWRVRVDSSSSLFDTKTSISPYLPAEIATSEAFIHQLANYLWERLEEGNRLITYNAPENVIVIDEDFSEEKQKELLNTWLLALWLLGDPGQYERAVESVLQTNGHEAFDRLTTIPLSAHFDFW